jgi:surface antigen
MSDCNCPWEYCDTQELLRNTAPINMTQEQIEQQEKFEFLKAAVVAAQAAKYFSPVNWDMNPKHSIGDALVLLNEVWKHKGKL